MGLGNQLHMARNGEEWPITHPFIASPQDQISSSIMQEIFLDRLHPTAIISFFYMFLKLTFIKPSMFKGRQKDELNGFKVDDSPNSLASHCLDLYTSTNLKFYAS